MNTREEAMTLVAAAAPVYPPASWFARHPNTPKGTRTIVEENGRAYGRLATWHGCHRTFANTCVTAPRSRTGYAGIHTGSTKTAEGKIIHTGVITVDTGHAPETWSLASRVKAHYDNTGTAVVAARFGEDADGIWWAGSVVPGVDEGRVQRLRQTPLSGDWRKFADRSTGLELIAALGVNTPGFTASVDGEDEINWPEGFEMDTEDNMVVHFEQGELTTLIASFAADLDDDTLEEFAEFENQYEDEIGVPDPDEGCGCPDVKAKVDQMPVLLTRSEAAARAAKLAAFAKL